MDRYDVSPAGDKKRGLAIIMTNDFHGTLSDLPFVWEDGIMLWKMFELLDFNVIWHANHSAREMVNSLKEDVKSTNDVGKLLACCVSSHGQQSVVLGQDKAALWIKRMVDTLASEDTEISRKLMAFQEDTSGRKIKFDVTQDFSRIAKHADVLLGFAAYQGTVSVGIYKKGSYYINELTKYLPAHTTEDIHVVLAAVCKRVQSIVFDGCTTEAQLPMVFSTLTKMLTFSKY
ncbi:caspase-10-like [Saccostrea cucullata]|uniref:caspase-10-like n=1 Tax=Saccostrea cuccullata TaxID=36930 RepID=UPI002ED53238